MRSLSRRPRDRADEASAYEAIFAASADAVVAYTLDGRITAWNQGAERLYGRPSEEMLGRSIDETYDPDLADEEHLLESHVMAGVAQSAHHRTRLRADGKPVDVVVSLSPIRGASGRVTGIASISRPITEAERAEARYAALLEAAPDAILCASPDGRIATLNAQAAVLFGYDRDELRGAELEVLLPDALRDRHRAHRLGYARHPQVRRMGSGLALLGRRRDGTTFPVEVSLAPDTSSGENMVIAAIRDVTEQRALEEATRENEIRLRQLAENVTIVFVLLQLDPPKYLYVSPGFRSLFGIDPATLDAEKALDLVHADDRESVSGEYLIASRAGRPAISEHRIVTTTGETRWVRSIATPIRNPYGAPERTVVTVEDISDRVRAAEALREAEAAARAANEAKNHFLSRMSHELRTPLNAVLGFGQLLERQLAGTEHSEAIGHVLRGGRHLLDLINDVLDITRIEAGEMSMSLEAVPCRALIEETLQLMAPLADDAGVSLTSKDLPDLHVKADRQRLRQVLLNLLSNAIKYNTRGGLVEVSGEEWDGQALVRVRDTGPGIPTDLQVRLFTPFDRLGAETTGVEGTGIGLAVTRSLVTLMGGTISIESGPGQGTRCTVVLPLAAAISHTSAQSQETPSSGQADEGLRPSAALLYIEDNEPNVRVIEHLLRLRPGWHLIHSALGRLGIELAQAHAPDAVLLDLHLPDLSGREVLAALKAHPATKGTPVAILTADAMPGHSRELLAAGADRFLTKPLDIDDVLGFLDAALTGRAADDR